MLVTVTWLVCLAKLVTARKNLDTPEDQHPACRMNDRCVGSLTQRWVNGDTYCCNHEEVLTIYVRSADDPSEMVPLFKAAHIRFWDSESPHGKRRPENAGKASQKNLTPARTKSKEPRTENFNISINQSEAERSPYRILTGRRDTDRSRRDTRRDVNDADHVGSDTIPRVLRVQQDGGRSRRHHGRGMDRGGRGMDHVGRDADHEGRDTDHGERDNPRFRRSISLQKMLERAESETAKEISNKISNQDSDSGLAKVGESVLNNIGHLFSIPSGYSNTTPSTTTKPQPKLAAVARGNAASPSSRRLVAPQRVHGQHQLMCTCEPMSRVEEEMSTFSTFLALLAQLLAC
ncbi:uncharacterized protein LOC131928610 [Physella acuta]|uniref:uncharacterized protein LOC131928610 n=1 Tax=Physella acuta TaxID=109671 RepID=UPI0027DE7CB1|nr:uncharacterized protein LOC131928610 [Physella acuta]